MPRYRLLIEYDGMPFVGWQVQAAGVSVQGRLAEALERFSGERFIPRGAGRTDAGVHATGQVAHIDLVRRREPGVVRDALNHNLKPDPIAVLACDEVDETFDARFSATARHYLYRIICRRAPLALERNHAWRLPYPLDATAMAAAAGRLLGRHDFTTFRAAGCQARSPVKTLDRFAVEAAGEEIRIRASARSFMHNQVRSMVGSLKLVGDGKWTADDLAAALAARDRARCGPVAPAMGLYLTGVDYAAQEPGPRSEESAKGDGE